MIFRFTGLLIGYGLAVFGGIGIIAYLSLLSAGFSVLQYMMFMLKQVELYLFIIGCLLITLSIYFPNHFDK